MTSETIGYYFDQKIRIVLLQIQRLLWLISEPLICEAADNNGFCNITGCGDCVLSPGKYKSRNGKIIKMRAYRNVFKQ